MPKAEDGDTSIAALPKGDEPLLRIPFDAPEARLPANLTAALDQLAGNVRDDQTVRLQLKAFAGGEGLSSSQARRLSLSRALSVRSYLMEKGIRSTRIDVRALGNKIESGPPNRVDIFEADR